MIPAQVEREILVEAPIDVVWRIVTEPEHIKEWFTAKAQLERRQGTPGRIEFPSGEVYYLRVEAFEPPHRFAYRWLHEEGTTPRPENSTLVEFTLRAEDSGTRVRVVESGFDQLDWEERARSKYAEDHSRGWSTLLERLRDYAPRAEAPRQ